MSVLRVIVIAVNGAHERTRSTVSEKRMKKAGFQQAEMKHDKSMY